MPEMTKTGPDITEGDVEAFESRLGYKLPNDYRAFLIEHNGGQPTPNRFDFDKGQSDSLIDRFYSLRTRGAYGFEFSLEVFEGRVPSELLPIARDPFGNLICLGVQGARRGEVYFWDHEREADEDAPDYRNVTQVAESFDAFLEKLRPRVD